jgi:hypothetical protein
VLFKERIKINIMLKIMYIIEVSRCSNSLQWYSNSIGHRFLCSLTKFGGFNTKILGHKFFIPEKDSVILRSVKIQGKAYSRDAFLIDIEGVAGHRELEDMLDMVNPNACTYSDKLGPCEQNSEASEVL